MISTGQAIGIGSFLLIILILWAATDPEPGKNCEEIPSSSFEEWNQEIEQYPTESYDVYYYNNGTWQPRYTLDCADSPRDAFEMAKLIREDEGIPMWVERHDP